MNPAKNSFKLMGEFPSKEQRQNCYGTVEDDFREIDAIIRDIIFLLYQFGVADHISLAVRERAFLGPLLKKNKSLVAPGS